MSRGRYTQAGGFVLAASILAGAIAGVILRQSSIGVLAGVAVGVALSVLIWLYDRRK